VEGQLASVRESLEDVGGAVGGGGAAGMRQRNSAYVQLKAQLNSAQAEIRAITEQQRELEDVRSDLQAQLARAPRIEQELLELNRRLETAIEERDEVAEKARTAGLSGSLEASSIGEQFVLAEPATVPRKPVRPSEKLILALGLVLAVGGGGASVMAVEMLDRSVRSSVQLAKIVGETPLAMIPQLATVQENRRRWLLRLAVVALALAGVVGVLVWVDRAVTPLIVVIYEIQNSVAAWLAANLPWTLGPVAG
jgi:capsular polysaccharide biosynthesis protein